MLEEGKKPASYGRVRVPTVIQMEAVECGAAALAMVLGYHGCHVPLEELRRECGVSRDGSKALNMIRAARKYGLEPSGWRMEPKDLLEVPLPFIVFWNFNHFIVVEGITRKRVYLNDPASGPRAITHEEFDEGFTGVTLSFVPTGEQRKRGAPKHSILLALAKRLKASKLALTFVLFASLFLVIPGLVLPSFSKVFVDDVLVGGMQDWFRPLLLGMAVVMCISAMLTYLQQHFLLRLQTKLAIVNSAQFFWHILRLPVEFFLQRQPGEIGDRVSINDKVAKLLSGDLATNVLNVGLIAFYAMLMFQYDVVLTLVGVLIAMTNVLYLVFISRKRRELSQKMIQDQSKLIGVAMGGLQVVETLKAQGAESDFFARWSGYHAKVLNAAQTLGRTGNLMNSFSPFLSGVATMGILGVGGLRVINGNLTIGQLVAFQSLMASFLRPVNQMVSLGTQFQELIGDINRIDDTLHYPQEAEVQAPPQAQPERLRGELELRDVTFGYSILEPPLIEDFSLKLKPGARVALVGASGSGKSTVSKLIAGLYKPWKGEVLLDSQPRSEIPRATVTNSLAMVDQEIFLFEGTIRDNLTIWDETIPDPDLMHAAKDAEIHDVITARAGGFQGEIDEGGRNFSGGQRQRLEIARALVNNPSILVLDEATSALDPATEKLVDQHLRRRGCTCVIVAHRLSTIRDCDEIIVLDRGKVVQRGTHDELIAAEGHYANLIRIGG